MRRVPTRTDEATTRAGTSPRAVLCPSSAESSMRRGLILAAALLSACGEDTPATGARERLERAMPRDRGVAAVPQFVPEGTAIRATVTRLDADEDMTKARTEVELAGETFVLEPGAEGAAYDRREAVLARVRARIASLKAQHPSSRGEIAEVRRRHPVPHRDIMLVLDAFIMAGVSDVNFVGGVTGDATK